MAKINPRDITRDTECYAAVKYDIGFRCGRLKGWKLYDLKNPDLYMTLSQRPSEILAAFGTQEELEQWREDLYKEPDAEKPKRKMRDFASFVDLFTPQLRVKALMWADAQTEDMQGDELMAWTKARMTRMNVLELDYESLKAFYIGILPELSHDVDLGMFADECAIACKLFYFGNGGEGIPNVISEGKNGSGKFVVSSIL